MRITCTTLIVGTLLAATANADPCSSGLRGATVDDGEPVFLVTPECFKAMDRSHAMAGVDQERIAAMKSISFELRLANTALVRSSTIAWDDSNRSQRAFLRETAENEALRERVRELQTDRMWRDLLFLGGGIILTALAGWTLGQAAN